MAACPFVGRGDVLAEIAAALESARAGRGGLVALTGAAGAGKTRTAEEAAARAEGFRVLWSWCPPESAGSSFRPWAGLLRELVADDVRCGRLAQGSPPLRALVAGQVAGVLRAADPETARLRLAGDVAELVRLSAERAPLLLVLDDVHDADPSSLHLLQELASTVRTARVLLLVTARDDEAAWRGRPQARAALVRRAHSLPLGPLPERDIAALLTAATGTDASPQAVRELAEHTGGEPFFVTELLRAGSGLPTTVRAAVAARVAELAPEGARVLAAASVLGTRFRLDVLAEAAGVPLDDLRAVLADAAAAGLLAPVEPGSGAFRHDLLREAVYAELRPAEQVALHRRSGEVLAELARRGRDVGPAEVAHHLLLAGPERAEAAARYARQAGDRAAELLAYEDAAQWYERSLPGSSGEALVEELIALGTARLGAGRRQAARAEFLRAAGLARTAGRPDLLASAALGLGAGPTGFEVDLVDREQTDLLEEARAGLREGKGPGGAETAGRTALRAAVTARLSVATALIEPEQRRLALAEEAVRTARSARDPATLAYALSALCDVRSGPDHCRDRLGWAGESVALARQAGEPTLELLGRRLRLVALLETGDIAGADAEALAYEAAARPLHRPLYEWYVPLWRGARALMEGRFEDCRAALDEAESLGEQAGSGNAAILVGTQRWCLLAESGDLPGIERLLADRPPLDRIPGVWPRVTLALLAAQFGRAEEAAQRLSAVAPSLAGAPRDSEWLPMLAQAADTIGLIGPHPLAQQLYDLLSPHAQLFVVEGIGAAVRGPVQRWLALLAAALGDSAAAREHAEAALAAARSTGAARLLGQLGQVGPGAGAAPGPPEDGVFRLDGELWQLRFAGREVRLPDSKGLHDLATLLARPGIPVPALDLVTEPAGPTGRSTTEAEGLHRPGDTGELLDATARTAYRRRLQELEQEAEEADAAGDSERSARIAVERDALVGQLSAAYGLGGRVRRTGSAAERARTAVTARIKAAVGRIGRAHPELGRHLSGSVRTGTLCVYQPETPPRWQL
ncbi:hypothetical protein GCM10010193_44920 [Kitasatospora atroaurantiaca]|uniref:AAA ATPase-like protein n=1 Tax=Kitasatospora atroaurantiaca TaxID=285545 RepID=A0A561EZU2_9ACTN|nr:AAA family ATPase [Kitasatospora atroaurantiaca]TWE21126.1 AAA ATPase-like protein [Kitasatospora atroaurantiaca]